MKGLEQKIRNVPDFPKPGIGFKDITTLLKDGSAFQDCINQMAVHVKAEEIDLIVGTESRGFIFAAALAYKLGKGFVPVRKPGKLPAATIKETYDLEYGTDSLEIHVDAIQSGARVLIIDDLLATGGTVAATVKLIERLKGRVVAIGFLIELTFLRGRDKLKEYQVFSLIAYDSE
ncbi:MAG: adenine phosphoribosyltransferase [Candidatus Zhuqueibacterota bacterium]